MSRFAYVNGRYERLRDAAVHIEDRGYQLADGIYEVTGLYGGRLLDEDRHLDRMDRSLAELRLPPPMSRAALKLVVRKLLRLNGVRDGIVYFQVTRGVAPRVHAFPEPAVPVALTITVRRGKPFDPVGALKGVAVIAVPDLRWKRCDIKAIALLPNVLGKQAAKEAGVFEAWMVDEKGRVTEGTSSNSWIVTAKGEIVTRAAGPEILNGITRQAVAEVAKEQGLKLVLRPFTLAEAKKAREAFLTSTTNFVKPVTVIDGKTVGEGKAGPVARRLLDLYLAHAEAQPEAVA